MLNLTAKVCQFNFLWYFSNCWISCCITGSKFQINYPKFMFIHNFDLVVQQLIWKYEKYRKLHRRTFVHWICQNFLKLLLPNYNSINILLKICYIYRVRMLNISYREFTYLNSVDIGINSAWWLSVSWLVIFWLIYIIWNKIFIKWNRWVTSNIILQSNFIHNFFKN